MSVSCIAFKLCKPVYKPFNSISSVVTELQNALACAGRLLDLIYEETEVPDADNAEGFAEC